MDDTAETRPPRLAPLLLLGVLAWLALDRPGNLAGESAVAYRLVTTLVSVAVVGYVIWRFHGIIPAAIAVALLRLIDAEPPPAAFLQRSGDAIFLATLGLGMAACARQGRPGNVRWTLLAIGAAALAAGWYAVDAHATEDVVARDRLRHVTLLVATAAVLVGVGSRAGSWVDRARLVAVVLLIPACGFVAARLVRGEWPRLLEGGEWGSVTTEWRAAVQSGTWDAGAWCWAPGIVCAPLMAIGLWRTLARGRKQLRAGRPPLAWLVTAAGVSAVAAVGARPIASGSLALAALGAILSVFGVFDLAMAVIERFQLQPPEPGPSDVPRVR